MKRCNALLCMPLIGLFWALSQPAAAQVRQCAGWADMRAALAERFDEAVVGTGLTSGGVALVVTAAPDGASWTLLGVRPTGEACILGHGEAWSTHIIAPESPGIEF